MRKFRYAPSEWDVCLCPSCVAVTRRRRRRVELSTVRCGARAPHGSSLLRHGDAPALTRTHRRAARPPASLSASLPSLFSFLFLSQKLNFPLKPPVNTGNTVKFPRLPPTRSRRSGHRTGQTAGLPSLSEWASSRTCRDSPPRSSEQRASTFLRSVSFFSPHTGRWRQPRAKLRINRRRRPYTGGDHKSES